MISRTCFGAQLSERKMAELLQFAETKDSKMHFHIVDLKSILYHLPVDGHINYRGID